MPCPPHTASKWPHDTRTQLTEGRLGESSQWVLTYQKAGGVVREGGGSGQVLQAHLAQGSSPLQPPGRKERGGVGEASPFPVLAWSRGGGSRLESRGSEL